MAWARVERTIFEGRPAVTKFTEYDARLEADGLRTLAAAGAPVPEVLAADIGSVTMSEVHGVPDWTALGRAVAAVHRHTADRFGYPIDNVIGPLPQSNPWTRGWGSFYAANRVMVHLADPAVPPTWPNGCGAPATARSSSSSTSTSRRRVSCTATCGRATSSTGRS